MNNDYPSLLLCFMLFRIIKTDFGTSSTECNCGNSFCMVLWKRSHIPFELPADAPVSGNPGINTNPNNIDTLPILVFDTTTAYYKGECCKQTQKRWTANLNFLFI